MNILERILSNGGISIGHDGASPKSGYMVSLQGSELIVPVSEASVEVIEKFRASVPEGDFFGAWVYDDKIFLDVSVNVQDKKMAMRFGVANNQMSIYDVSKGKSIFL